MKITTLRLSIAALAGIALLSRPLINQAIAQERTNESPSSRMSAPSGKVTPWAAMKIATARTGGHASSAIFEFEDGHWIYGVIIAKGGKLKEAEIDATTGKIGDVEDITPSGEAKEMQGDLEKALKAG